ncbi:hypothetical protein [Thermus hydrothermalis]|uniref:hypothetical protein n=1 Tax=Thermus hydrothermalis TaxID=2908148 RepID=UPI001FA970F6|nr:hypothetical protein [Thermus hydrothermalis]
MRNRKPEVKEIVDELAEGLPRHTRIAYHLYDLSRDLVRFANEIQDTQEVDEAELARLTRRLFAAYVALHADTDLGAREVLANPHRLRGVECP